MLFCLVDSFVFISYIHINAGILGRLALSSTSQLAWSGMHMHCLYACTSNCRNWVKNCGTFCMMPIPSREDREWRCAVHQAKIKMLCLFQHDCLSPADEKFYVLCTWSRVKCWTCGNYSTISFLKWNQIWELLLGKCSDTKSFICWDISRQSKRFFGRYSDLQKWMTEWNDLQTFFLEKSSKTLLTEPHSGKSDSWANREKLSRKVEQRIHKFARNTRHISENLKNLVCDTYGKMFKEFLWKLQRFYEQFSQLKISI